MKRLRIVYLPPAIVSSYCNRFQNFDFQTLISPFRWCIFGKIAETSSGPFQIYITVDSIMPRCSYLPPCLSSLWNVLLNCSRSERWCGPTFFTCVPTRSVRLAFICENFCFWKSRSRHLFNFILERK